MNYDLEVQNTTKCKGELQMKTNQRGEQTKKKIFSSLNTLLKTKIFQDITITEIIEQSAISRTAFYHHFKSKEDIFEKLIEQIAKEYFNEHIFTNNKNIHDQIIRNLIILYDQYDALMLTFIDLNILEYLSRNIEDSLLLLFQKHVDINYTKSFLRYFEASYNVILISWLREGKTETTQAIYQKILNLEKTNYYRLQAQYK